MQLTYLGATKGKGVSEKGKGNPFDFSQLTCMLPATSFKNDNVDIQGIGGKSATLPITPEFYESLAKGNYKIGQVLDVVVDLVEYKGRFSPLGVSATPSKGA